MLKHTKEYYIKFFLVFVLLFFLLTYSIVNNDTILDQLQVLKEGGSFFASFAVHDFLSQDAPPFPSDTTINAQTYEIELLIHEQVNQVRKEHGVRELDWDPMLAKLAREHSKRMIVAGFFNHTDPFGDGPNERAEKMGLKRYIDINNVIYTGIGENIAITPRGKVEGIGILITNEDIASGAILGWMLSLSHKKTILTSDYFFSGVGVVYDGHRNYYITHNFQ